ERHERVGGWDHVDVEHGPFRPEHRRDFLVVEGRREEDVVRPAVVHPLRHLVDEEWGDASTQQRREVDGERLNVALTTLDYPDSWVGIHESAVGAFGNEVVPGRSR